jgi:hypothetical protein
MPVWMRLLQSREYNSLASELGYPNSLANIASIRLTTIRRERYFEDSWQQQNILRTIAEETSDFSQQLLIACQDLTGELQRSEADARFFKLIEKPSIAFCTLFSSLWESWAPVMET